MVSLSGVCSVAPILRRIDYTHGIQEDDTEAAWNEAWQKYNLNSSSEPAEKRKLMQALTQTRVVWLIHRSGSH